MCDHYYHPQEVCCKCSAVKVGAESLDCEAAWIEQWHVFREAVRVKRPTVSKEDTGSDDGVAERPLRVLRAGFRLRDGSRGHDPVER